MNRQEVFNTVRKHLLKQNAKAETWGGSCRYRTAEGLKCAVGCLIASEHYHPDFEGLTPTLEGAEGDGAEGDSPISRTKRLLRAIADSLGIPEITSEDASFLKELQSIHDDCVTHKWSAKLEEFAFMNNLSID